MGGKGVGTATISPLQSYSVATVPSSPVRLASVERHGLGAVEGVDAMVAIWYMNSVSGVDERIVGIEIGLDDRELHPSLTT